MKIDTIIGIDPGAQGGIAVFTIGRNVSVAKMPKDITKLRDFFAYYAETYHPIVFLEKLSVRPDDVTATDGRANLGKLYRIQKMMANYEHLKALLETSGIPFVMVHPMSWQTKLKLRTIGSGEEKRERKHRYCEVAGRLYPNIKATLWNADALLIMHFGRWALMNDLNWVKSNLPASQQDKLF